MAIATLVELKRYLTYQGSANDDLLNAMLDAASETCERLCERQFEPDPSLVAGEDTATPVVRRFSTRGGRRVAISDLRSATQVTLAGTVLAAYTAASGTGYLLVGETPHTVIYLYGAGHSQVTLDDLEITGRFGWNPIPADIRDAVLTLAARRFRERDASFADSVQDTELGTLSFSRQLPPAVASVFDSYRPPPFP
jgi:hypothetical protein